MKLPPKTRSKRGVYKKKGLIHGVGINDADYVTQKYEVINGKKVRTWICPFYEKWKGVLRRCYSKNFHLKASTYKDCSICDEWKYFSNFKRWMGQQDWEGKELDKDLLIKGNKVYSPETCIFVEKLVNTFVNAQVNSRGRYMIGVGLDKKSGKFRVECSNPFTGKGEYLGIFTDELEGHLAWKARKHELACMLAESEYCNDPRLAQALKTRYL